MEQVEAVAKLCLGSERKMLHPRAPALAEPEAGFDDVRQLKLAKRSESGSSALPYDHFIALAEADLHLGGLARGVRQRAF